MSFSSGLCQCGDACDTCCVALFCPCVVLGWNVDTMTKAGIRIPLLDCGQSTAMAAAGVYGSGVAAQVCAQACERGFGILQCVSVLVHCEVRRNLRLRHGIRGNCCEDFCTTLCCTSCALTQEMKHLKVAPSAPPATVNTMKVPDEMGGSQKV